MCLSDTNRPLGAAVNQNFFSLLTLIVHFYSHALLTLLYPSSYSSSRTWRRETFSSRGTPSLTETRPGDPLLWSQQHWRANCCYWTESTESTWEPWLSCPGTAVRWFIIFDGPLFPPRCSSECWHVWCSRLLHDRELDLYDGTRLLRWDRYQKLKEELKLTDGELKER